MVLNRHFNYIGKVQTSVVIYYRGMPRATHKNESLIPPPPSSSSSWPSSSWRKKKREREKKNFFNLHIPLFFFFLSLTIEYFNWINKESIKIFILIRRKEEFWPWSNLQIRHLLLLTNRFGKSIKAWLYYSTSILFQCLFIWFFFVDIYWKMKYL